MKPTPGYAWLHEALEVDPRPRPLPKGATEAALQKCAKAFGVELPPSYADFLRNWNGLQFLHGYEVNILSAEEAARWREENEGDDYYDELPAHCMVVRKQALGSEVYCLDTRSKPTKGELPIVRFDASEDPPLKKVFPSFEAMVLEDARAAFDGPKSRELFASICERLKARGAKDVEEVFVDWKGWKHEFGPPTPKRKAKKKPAEPKMPPPDDFNPEQSLTWLRQKFSEAETLLRKAGVDPTCLRQHEGRVSTVYLSKEKAKGLQRVWGLAIGSGAKDVEALGAPTHSGSDWRRFDRDGVALHVTIARRKVSAITLMDLATLPAHLR